MLNTALFVLACNCMAAQSSEADEHAAHHPGAPDPQASQLSETIAPPPPAASAPAMAVARIDDEPPAETLLGRRIVHGGFGGPTMSYSTLRGDAALVVGGRGGWLINHRLVIGGGGYGVTNRISVPPGTTAADADHQLTFGYGGFWTEYVIAPSRLVHGSLGVLVGGGGLAYHRFRPTSSNDSMSSDSVFVVDPTVSIELNVIEFMRVVVFADYRLVAGVDLPGLRNKDVSGFGAGTMLKFGKF